MSWSKVSERRWERPASGIEGYFIFLENLRASTCEGRQPYTIFSKIKIEHAIPEIGSALRQAWKQFRYEQPHIATNVDATPGAMKMIYEVPDDAALEQWLASTFVISSADNTEQIQQMITFQQTTLFYLPKSSELVLRAHHHLIDGTGVMLFWDRFLDILSSPSGDIKFGDEPSRLPPTLDAVMGFTTNPTLEQLEESHAMIGDYLANAPGISPVSKIDSVPSADPQNAEFIFSESSTQAIIKACKSKGITVTSAVHAAYIKTLMQQADPESNLASYTSMGQFNLRDYIPQPYSTKQYAVSTYYTGCPLVMKLPGSFLDLAQELNNYYSNRIKGKSLELHAIFDRILCDAVQNPEYLASPIPKDALVSSLGIAERHLQRQYGESISVKDFKICVSIFMGLSMLFFYTFRDQLRLVYSFNDGSEDRSNVESYLNSIQSVLEKELLC